MSMPRKHPPLFQSLRNSLICGMIHSVFQQPNIMLKVYKTIALLVFLSFLSLVIGSSLAMRHSMDSESSSGCPFSLTDTSVCLQNNIVAITHHLSAYQAFLNVQPIAGMTALLALIFLSVWVLYAFGHKPDLLSPPSALVAVLARTLPFPEKPQRRITRWLSLFENSPSLL